MIKDAKRKKFLGTGFLEVGIFWLRLSLWRLWIPLFWLGKRQSLSLLQMVSLASPMVVDRDVWADKSIYLRSLWIWLEPAASKMILKGGD